MKANIFGFVSMMKKLKSSMKVKF